MNIFETRKQTNGKTHVPVWFMRQAGRYHAHYQNLKKSHDFMTLCKDPKLACEVTMGPIEDFGFNAAILFSDLLFPLEHLGMGLNYLQGPPKLAYHLNEEGAFEKLRPIQEAKSFYQFQGEAVKNLKTSLPSDVTLLGFVGAPFTLYTYAMEGSHAGSLIEAKKGLYDGRFERFLEHLMPSLLTEIEVQAKSGIDALCLFDTAVGELCLKDFKKFMVPLLQTLGANIKKIRPDLKIIYYSRNTHLEYHQSLENDHFDVLGVDWRVNLVEALKTLSKDYFVQGNIDPCWLHISWEQLEANLIEFKEMMLSSGADLNRWICGLGHGVLIQTPEENVRRTVQFIQSITY